MIVAQFAVGQVLMSMIWFFLIFIWIMLLFRVFADVFRSQDLSGVMEVLWVLFVIARGPKMAENEIRSMQAQEAATREYIRSAATVSPADELARLADLKDRGVIDDKEFAAMKAKLLA